MKKGLLHQADVIRKMIKMYMFRIKYYYVLFIFLILFINIVIILNIINTSNVQSNKDFDTADNTNKKHSVKHDQINKSPIVTNVNIHEEIFKEYKALSKYYFKETRSNLILNKFLNTTNKLFLYNNSNNIKHYLNREEINEWIINKNKNYSNYIELINKSIYQLHKLPIIKSELFNRGTQLKLLLTLESNKMNKDVSLKVIFKPKWYENNTTFPNVFDGKDRHYGEYIAFLLSIILLNINYSVPVSIVRRINMNEIIETASDELNKTFIIKNDNGRHKKCFYGTCLYCNINDPICASENDMIEGAVVLFIKSKKFNKRDNPYQRSYKKNKYKKWQVDNNYCHDYIVYTYDEEFILDLIELSIFDFLIQNGDRHHLESITIKEKKSNNNYNYDHYDSITKEKLLLIDNGKSFGNPDKDFLDSLAPLYQCCRLRKNTYDTLFQLRGGLLSRMLTFLMNKNGHEDDDPVLNEKQLRGIDRRLNLVFSAVSYCTKKRGKSILV